jgi:multiple sugar transport system permease protein
VQYTASLGVKMSKKESSIFPRIAHKIDKNLGIVFLIPGIFLLAVIIVYPITMNLVLGFSNAHLIFPDTEFIGLKNFIELLTDPRFHNAAKITFIWTVSSVALQVLAGLVTALLLREKSGKNAAFRSMIIIPYALPPITIALVWRWMLNSLYGVINFIFVNIGIIQDPISWLGTPATALPTAVLINTWFGFPLLTISILAGLQSIPSEHYEVAHIEGANGPQIFRFVTLPGIKQILGIMVILRIIWVFNSFDILYLLTSGGPLGSTETLPILAYYTGWRSRLVGKAGAIATLLFIFLMGLMLIYFRVTKIEEIE